MINIHTFLIIIQKFNFHSSRTIQVDLSNIAGILRTEGSTQVISFPNDCIKFDFEFIPDEKDSLSGRN